ncbi:hypothetical protein [Fodinibius sp. AD559]|uniref:hypothetical protein n=1 Tax=Fodinibius sp. AD559 TaxID=3424179 RepID=UPI00404702FA
MRGTTIKKLETYRGAVLYEANELDEKDAQLLNYKVVAKSRHPEEENLLLDFIGEATKEQKAIKIVKNKIDNYLSEHNLNKLDPGTGEFQNES